MRGTTGARAGGAAAVLTRTDQVSHRGLRKGMQGSIPNPTRNSIVKSSCMGKQRGRVAQPSPPGRLCGSAFGGGFSAPPAGRRSLPGSDGAYIGAPLLPFPQNAVLFVVLIVETHSIGGRRLAQAPDRMIFRDGCALAQAEMGRWAHGAMFEERSRTLMAHQ